MTRFNLRKTFIAVAAVAAYALSIPAYASDSDRLVILHTNDTHSIIDPYYRDNLGGVLRRKALIDSVRSVEPNVLLVDAGDVLQGSLYFTLFEGKVEQMVMNGLGYDVQILGNHEFDNGMEKLANYLKGLNADLIATNYDLSHTDIDRYFKPYTIKEVDGKRIGFLAININPEGLIASAKCTGVEYLDAVKAANAMAWYLRHVEHCDYVIAVSHIGYDEKGKISDAMLARNTEGIDVIIGGHSHTLVNPDAANPLPSRFVNLAGDTVLVAQTGRYGANLGEITLDLNSGKADSKIITVTDRLDSNADPELAKLIGPYKHKVDSVYAIKVGTAETPFECRPELMNWMADFVLDDSRRLTKKKIDMAIVNVGGIRSPFPAGDITKGMIMQAFPFDNYEVVLEISGADLAATLDSLAANGGNGVSRNVRADMDVPGRRCVKATVNGRPIDPSRTYYVATINYLAQGNDGMGPLKRGHIVAQSKNFLYDDMINAFEKGFLKKKKQRPDSTVRMKPVE